MRGQDQSSSSPFGYVHLESRVPAEHPLCPIGVMLGVTPHVAQSTYYPESHGPFSRRWGDTS